MYRPIIKLLFLSILIVAIHLTSSGQTEKLEIDGAIQIGNSQDPSPDPGTIRWTGSEFQGWNGFMWLPLSNFKINATKTDVAGNEYPTVLIGSQEWMAQNLKTSEYRNNVGINLVLPPEQHTWIYGNNHNNLDIYGRLYDWTAVSNNQGLCPTGWHVPSDSDWNELVSFLGGINIAGGKMKETGTSHLDSPNFGATNESGFTGLPGDFTQYDSFNDKGAQGIWWSSTEVNTSFAKLRSINSSNHNIIEDFAPKEIGLSVRCIKD